MKRLLAILLCLGICISMASCTTGSKNTNETSLETEELDSYRNTRLLAYYLDTTVENQKILILESFIEDIGAGNIDDVSCSIVNGSDYELLFTGDNGTHYRVILAETLAIIGIQDLDTGEWIATL